MLEAAPAFPLRRAGSWRKQWRYFGAFCDEAFVVAARVQVGPLGQTFWAVLDRRTGELSEHTRLRIPGTRGEVFTEPGRPRTRIDTRGVGATIEIGDGLWAEAHCENNGNEVWTRKRVGVPVALELRVGEKRIDAGALGVEDESAGFHPRPTEWYWSAGVGTTASGSAVGWNLVSGINDPDSGSERAIWLDGKPHEPGPVSFDPELGGITFPDGSALDFVSEGERRAKQNLGLVRYDYRQPFGTFSGSLDGERLESGIGVMEYHLAYW